MERCSIVLSLNASSYRYRSGSKIDVWELKAPRRLDPLSVSWSTRPSRNHLFSSFILDDNTTAYETPEFRCSSGSLHGFEFACSDSKACQLEYQQDAKKHDLGASNLSLLFLVSLMMVFNRALYQAAVVHLTDVYPSKTRVCYNIHNDCGATS